MTLTRSPAAIGLSATHTHSSEPSTGRWKRTLPRSKGATAATSRPISPMASPAEVPMRVFWKLGLKTRNQSTTMASEAAVQVASCAVSDRSGKASMSRPTSRAPRPNQMTKNDGMASSATISAMPPTIHAHHSRCMCFSLRAEYFGFAAMGQGRLWFVRMPGRVMADLECADEYCPAAPARLRTDPARCRHSPLDASGRPFLERGGEAGLFHPVPGPAGQRHHQDPARSRRGIAAARHRLCRNGRRHAARPVAQAVLPVCRR